MLKLKKVFRYYLLQLGTHQLFFKVYDSDSILIPKNTSVIVARVPVANSKKSWNKSDKSNVS